MALVKCKDCGNEMSTDAKKCPKCGANPPNIDGEENRLRHRQPVRVVHPRTHLQQQQNEALNRSDCRRARSGSAGHVLVRELRGGRAEIRRLWEDD